MIRLILVVLCSIALQAFAADRTIVLAVIDLDRPGALEALKRDNPKHYDAVMKRVDEVQTVEYSDSGLRNLTMFWQPDFLETAPYGNLVKPSDPAQARITVMVDMQPYRITVHYTKNPATIVPAR